MKAKLIKTENGYGLEDCDIIAFYSTIRPVHNHYKLSKQNCDEIFGVVDVNSEVEAIVKTICPNDRGKGVIYGTGMAVGIQCFNKAMELNKDKLFTLEDMGNLWDFCAYNKGSFIECLESLRQPTEIEVEIVMENYVPKSLETVYPTGGIRPKLDENGCLILIKL